MKHSPTANRGVTERGSATRNRILTCAVELIAQRGYNATNVEAICVSSGVSRGSVLYQFPNRFALMQAVADHSADLLLEGIQQGLASEKMASSRLMQFADVIWDMSNSKPALSFAELQDAAHWDIDLAVLIKPASESLASRLIDDLCETCLGAGIANPQEIAAGLMLMIFAMRSLVIALRLHGSDTFLQATLDKCKADWCTQIAEALKATEPAQSER
jgi:AcrR family transcriptional regulator